MKHYPQFYSTAEHSQPFLTRTSHFLLLATTSKHKRRTACEFDPTHFSSWFGIPWSLNAHEGIRVLVHTYFHYVSYRSILTIPPSGRSQVRTSMFAGVNKVEFRTHNQKLANQKLPRQVFKADFCFYLRVQRTLRVRLVGFLLPDPRLIMESSFVSGFT